MTDALQWTTARDGSRTARFADGSWLAGCSLPDRAADAMARKLEVAAAVCCLLAPTHAAQVRAVLDKLRPEQAVIAVLPEKTDLAIHRACRDFSEAEAAGRLFFAAGENWAGEIESTYAENPGLPVPGELVRLAATDAATFDALRPEAEAVIGTLSRDATAAVEAARAAWVPGGEKLLLIATGRFALWDDDGHLLRSLCRGEAVERLDPLDPRTSGPRAVARAATGCGAAASAGLFRADLRSALPDAMPLTAWAGGDRVPAFDPAFPADRLLVPGERNRAAALKSGWPGDRVTVAARPPAVRPVPPGRPTLALIADLPESLDPPAAVREYSSHRLLWEAMATELAADPAAVGTDARAYFQGRLARFGIAAGEAPFALFRDGLILPAVRRAVAAGLWKIGVPLRVYGRGWEGYAGRGGPVATRGAFDAAVDASAALLDLHRDPAPLLATGRPVLHAMGRPVDRVAREARAMLGRPVSVGSRGNVLSAKLLLPATIPPCDFPRSR